MKIIYNCYGGAHSSVVVGYIHSGLLQSNVPPTRQQLMSLSYFDSQRKEDHGILQFLGNDAHGNEIYSVGLEGDRKFGKECLENIAAIMGIDNTTYVMVDTINAVNWYMRIGGFLSRALGLTWIGRPLVIYGTQRAFSNLKKIPEKTLKELKLKGRGEK